MNALKKLQLDTVAIEAEFYRKVHDLECEYSEKFAPLVDKVSLVNTVSLIDREMMMDVLHFSASKSSLELMNRTMKNAKFR